MRRQTGNDGGSGLNLLSGSSTADTRAVRRPRNGEQFRALYLIARRADEQRRRSRLLSCLAQLMLRHLFNIYADGACRGGGRNSRFGFFGTVPRTRSFPLRSTVRVLRNDTRYVPALLPGAIGVLEYRTRRVGP